MIIHIVCIHSPDWTHLNLLTVKKQFVSMQSASMFDVINVV